MAKKETILEAFLSSPSDQSQERQLIADVISEHNKIWSRAYGIRLDLLRWETDVVPGVGASAQEVINIEIGDDYDIFIGILGTRFGSRTQTAGSGTEEEFRRAYTRFKASGKPHILVYFSEKPVSPSEIETSQFALVQEFKNGLGAAGVLFKEFRSDDELEKLVRLHLDTILGRWDEGEQPPDGAKSIPPPVEPPQADSEESEDEQLGLFDYLDMAFERGAEFREVMERMTDATAEVGQRISRRTEQMERLGEVKDAQSFKHAKAAVLGAATDLSMFAKRIENETPIFSSSYGEIINAYTQILRMVKEFPATEDEERVTDQSVEQITELLQAIRGSGQGVVSFRNSIKSMPPIASQFNRAQRRAVETLEALIEEFSTAENLTEELLRSFEAEGELGSTVV